MKKLFLLTLLSVFFSGCGGGSGGTPSEQPPGVPENRSIVSGTISAPDTSTPIPDATVYVASSSSPKSEIVLAKVLGEDCPLPAVSYVAAVCTEDDGTFELELDEGELYTIQVSKGAFFQSFVVDLTDNSDNVEVGIITFDVGGVDGTQIAVATGSFDRMQDVLAKTGFGAVDSFGELILGSETFDLYDGDGSLDSGYPEIGALFQDNGGQAKIFDYDIVFLNCDTSELNISGLSEQGNRDTLRAFVEEGGRIYATDWAYDFIEQVFPEYFDFHGSNDTPVDQPEALNVAQLGSTESVDAQINDLLVGFLSNVTCTGGDCLNPDGQSILVEDFLAGWAVMDDVHSSAAGVDVWVVGEVETFAEEVGQERPLTVSASVGQGKIIYSSYHTAHSGSTGFLPQERILQYLVFE